MRTAHWSDRMSITKRGSTLVLVAVVLAGFLALVAFVVDAAAAYVTRARLQSFADAGADAGATKLSDLVVQLASAREPNPPEGSDPRAYLTDADRQAILTNPSVVETVRDYVERNRAGYQLTLDGVEVVYPISAVQCSEASLRSVELRVTLKKNQPFLLGRILNGNESVFWEVNSLRSMLLCP